MADVFVSYDRDDQARIAKFVDLLEAQGWSVFWDRDIPLGENWRSHISGALEQASCVVVLWTKRSIESDWVAEEADFARQKEILVSVLLDQVTPPLGFRTIQAAPLHGWPDTADQTAVVDFLHTVASISGARTKKASAEHSHPATSNTEFDQPAAPSAAAYKRSLPLSRRVIAVVTGSAIVVLATTSLLISNRGHREASQLAEPVGSGTLVAPPASDSLGSTEADIGAADSSKTRIQDLKAEILPIRSKILQLLPSITPLRGRTK